MKQTKPTTIALLLLTMCLYGSIYVSAKYLLAVYDPMFILFIRYLLSSAVLLPLVLLRPRQAAQTHKLTFRDAAAICAIGILGYAAGVGAQMLGTKYAGAATASVINATNPITITLFAAVAFREKLVWHRIAAIAAAIAGAVVIVGGVGRGELVGIAWSVVSSVLWSLMSVMLRPFTKRYDPLTVTAVGIAAAGIALIPVVVIGLLRAGALPPFTVCSVLNLVYLAILCTALAHTLWNDCLSRADASFCSLFYPVQPLASTVLAVVFLHEAVTLSLITGGILIAGGIVFAMLMDRRAAGKPSR